MNKEELKKQIEHCEQMKDMYAALAKLVSMTMKRDHLGVPKHRFINDTVDGLEIMGAVFHIKARELEEQLNSTEE